MSRVLLISTAFLLLALGVWLAFRALRPEPPPASAHGETLQPKFGSWAF